MKNLVNRIPVDRGGNQVQDMPAPVIAVAASSYENGTTSSVITLTQDTTSLEVTAVSAPAFIKWIPTTDTQASVVATIAGANYDHVIPTGMMRRFQVPADGTVVVNPQSVQGLNRANGLYQRVAYKTAGIGSVLATQYGLGS